MPQVTAALVKQLREMTGSPMMECKKALDEANGDIEAAVDILRKSGAAKAVKKAGRATNEGAVLAYVTPDGTCGAIAELKCETDFVSGTDVFKQLVTKIAKAAAENDPADIDALKASTVDGETVDALITEGIHNMGENMTLTRFARLASTDGQVASYVHMGGKIGVVVSFAFAKPETAQAEAFKTMAHDVAMQIAAARPISPTRDSIPQEVIDHELSIYRAQAAESGKPAAIQERIVNGSLEKFYKENTLVGQQFVKDPNKTVEQYINETAKQLDDKVSVKDFRCFALGEE
jgi:elongation factor Ts